ncbi:MAG: hypothetical protein C0597_02340 [Marinilabiliales bacterium]|nr:MAG: hypothetical protein C0597_02340 [Marinilabiliales bacterium]
MIILNLNHSSKIPLYQQIVDHFIYMIDNNILKTGDNLPSTRSLAKQHDLNRNTIYKAYEELWALGYIESTPGSYSKVRKRIITLSKDPVRTDHNLNWDSKITKGASILRTQFKKKESKTHAFKPIDFRPLSPDPHIIPNDEFRKCLNEVLLSKGHELLYYGDPEGFRPLREFLETHMRLHSIHVDFSEIIITNGAQNALELIVKLLIDPGDVIVIEKPTYSEAIPIFKYHQAKIIEIPITDEGLDLEKLELVLESYNPKFLYTMPNFQNPTGTTTSQKHREKLLEICEKFELPIIEDGFVEEMKYFVKNILPIKSMDKAGLVFYIGTFSKVLFPGIRLGWIASNLYCSQRITELKMASEISMNTMVQAGIELFCRKGYYEKQIRRIHSVYKKRMGLSLKILRDGLNNKNFEYTKPIGGYTIWFETNANYISESELLEKLNHDGVLVTGGEQSFYTKNNKTCFRISIAHRNETEIDTGIKRILQTLNSLKR